MQRQREQTIQYQLTLERVRDVKVYVGSQALQAAVAACMNAFTKALKLAELQTEAAQVTLLQQLGLIEWSPPQPSHYVRYSGEAFSAGRLDAEYFSPRVHELMARLGRGSRTLADVATVRREVFSAEDSGDFSYIEIGGVGADGTAKAELTPHDEAPSRAAWVVRAGDVITSMVRPIRRLSAQISADQDGAVCSSGFVVLQPTKLLPEVLMTYLRLPLVCEVLDLHTSASLYPAISEVDLLRLPVPAIADETQQEIVNAVAAARAARKRAQALLAAAQRAVEIAIEESEQSALQHLLMVAPKRPLAPLMHGVRVERLPDIPVDLRKHTGLVIPDSARSKDDGLTYIAPLSPHDVLAVIEGAGPPAVPQAASDPQAQLLSDPRNVPLWFGSNREPVDRQNIGLGFSGRRSSDGSVHHGRCIVNVPEGHALGSTGTAGLKGWWRRWRHGVDDRLRLLHTEGLDEPAFWQAVRAAMDEADADQRVPEALLFVHGYRVSFEDAALRAAQLAYDLKIRDTSFFAWPSAGAAAEYTVDEASAKNATRPLAEFIAALDACAQASGKALHIVAHSMGNRVLLAALQWLVSHGRAPQAVDKIVCAAPDEDAADFVAAMAELRQVGRRRTLYASSKDKPVWLSEVVHGYPRAGRIPPVTLAEGLDTVDASELEATFLGHSDFATKRPLLQDLFSLLKASLEPRQRLGLEAVTNDAGAYWRLKP